MFIPSLDVTAETDPALRQSALYLGSILLENASVKAVQELINETRSTLFWARADTVDDAVALWDAGVFKVVFQLATFLSIRDQLEGIAEDRIVLEAASAEELAPHASAASVLLVQTKLSEAVKGPAALAKTVANQLLKDGGARRVVVQAKEETVTLQGITQLNKDGVDVVIPLSQLTTAFEEEEKGKINLGKAFLASAKTDRDDGLYTTMVVDERNVALGLVYSSAQSVAESIRMGQGVYQSRARGLWYKGATSGATQTLLHVDYDCDGDALRFVVKQHGAGTFLFVLCMTILAPF